MLYPSGLRALLKFKRAQAGTPSEIPVRAAGRDNLQPGKRRSRLDWRLNPTAHRAVPAPPLPETLLRPGRHRPTARVPRAASRWPGIRRFSEHSPLLSSYPLMASVGGVLLMNLHQGATIIVYFLPHPERFFKPGSCGPAVGGSIRREPGRLNCRAHSGAIARSVRLRYDGPRVALHFAARAEVRTVKGRNSKTRYGIDAPCGLGGRPPRENSQGEVSG